MERPVRRRAQRWEGSRPRDPPFPKPRAFPNQGRKYTVGFENAFAARGDPTSPSATTNGRKTTGTSDRQRALPTKGFSNAYVTCMGGSGPMKPKGMASPSLYRSDRYA